MALPVAMIAARKANKGKKVVMVILVLVVAALTIWGIGYAITGSPSWKKKSGDDDTDSGDDDTDSGDDDTDSGDDDTDSGDDDTDSGDDEFSQSPAIATVEEYSTVVDSDGDGKVIFLDRHKVECSNGALNQFKLRRLKDSNGETTKIKYHYTCNDGVVGAGEEKTTPADIVDHDVTGGTIYLDRHNVDCGSLPIRTFKLHRPSEDELSYKYTCGDKSVDTSTCRDVTTNEEPMNSSIFLDRQNVKCEDGEYITQFKLNNKGNGKWSYGYKCCKLNS